MFFFCRRKFKLNKDSSDARQEDDLMAKSVLTQINRILTNHLSSNLPHIMDSQVFLYYIFLWCWEDKLAESPIIMPWEVGLY